MQILIIGKGAKEYALAKYLKKENPESIIFVAPGNQAIGDFATCIDIQPQNIDEIVDFAQANEINLTIVCDDMAIDADLASAMNEAGLMVFAPEKEAARFAISKSVGKRFMYKLKMRTPKFGIFDKENSAREYLNSAVYPILIKSDLHDDGENIHLCLSSREANNILNKLFSISSPKVVIENYVQGREFTFYAITDGYNAIPICAVVPYKYSSEKDGGSITKGVGAYAPANFVDNALSNKILDTIIYPAINELDRNNATYIGIIGVDLILDNDNDINVIEFNSFFKEPDIETILELLDNNLIEIFKACAIGSLADDYNFINLKNKSAMSAVLTKTPKYLFDNDEALLSGIDELDEEINVTLYNAINKNNQIKLRAGRALSLTTSAATLSKAKALLQENIDLINFNGKRYRTDILITNNDK